MLIISDGKEKALHISEIGTLIIENTAVNLTAYLLCELSRYKVKMYSAIISATHTAK